MSLALRLQGSPRALRRAGTGRRGRAAVQNVLAVEGSEAETSETDSPTTLGGEYEGDMYNIAELDLSDLTYEMFAEALESHQGLGGLKVGDRVTGTIVAYKGNKGAYVDIGAKSPAWLNRLEMGLTTKGKVADLVQLGQEVECIVTRDELKSWQGNVNVSLKAILLESAWNNLREAQANDAVVEAQVIGANRGGLVVTIFGMEGFVPKSQTGIAQMTEESGPAMIGKMVSLKLIEVSEERERLVGSIKAAIPREELNFKVGDVVMGTVQAVKPYGAFIGIGTSAVSGLLHISQISHERVTAVENVLAMGDELKVMILSQDSDRGRVSLSTKKLEPTPGDMIRNPALVFEKAEEMAASFRERVAAAEAAARAEEDQAQAAFDFEAPAEEEDLQTVEDVEGVLEE